MPADWVAAGPSGVDLGADRQLAVADPGPVPDMADNVLAARHLHPQVPDGAETRALGGSTLVDLPSVARVPGLGRRPTPLNGRRGRVGPASTQAAVAITANSMEHKGNPDWS